MAVKPKAPKPTKYDKGTGSGIARIGSDNGANISNFAKDFSRNTLNAGGAILNFLSSKNQPKYGLGDRQVGLAPDTAKAAAAAKQASDYPKVLPAIPGPEQIERDGGPKTLADYMNEARAMGIGGGDGTNYDALINQIRANGASGDAKLQAMYQQLAASNAADSTGIAANFDSTGSKIATASDAAAKDTAQAYDQTKAAQTQQLADLGISQASGVLQSNGAQADRDRNIALANQATNKAADLNQNTAHAANAQQYNTGVVESNRSAGTEARSSLQQALASKLAELESAKASSTTGNASAVLSAAQQLMGLDPSNPANQAAAQQSQTKADLANQLTASQIAVNQAKANGSQKTLTDALKGSTGGYATLHQAFIKAGGQDDGSGQNFSTFVKTLKTINGIN